MSGYSIQTQFRFGEKCETLSKYYAIEMTYHLAVFNIKTPFVFNIKFKEVPRWTTIINLFSAAFISSP